MKINISRQNIYLLTLSIFLLIFVLIFSFLILIPKGKEYRAQRGKLNIQKIEYKRYQKFSDSTLEKLKKLQSENRNTITAFDRNFNPEKFQKIHASFFTSLNLAKKISKESEDDFLVYEVNTTSSIHSPQSFYDFLDAINSSDWIIKVNFPINFKRDAELIRSSFTMKVYNAQKIDTNSSDSE